MIIGYARVSTDDQKLEAQTDALTEAGAERVFADKITGSTRSRPQLDQMLDHLRQGDVVVVTKYDRLARSLRDLLDIVEVIAGRGAGFRSLAEDIDTTTPGRSPRVPRVRVHRPVRTRADIGAHEGRPTGCPQAWTGRRPSTCPISSAARRGKAHAR